MYARYTEYLRDIMLDEYGKKLLEDALSEYPLYSPKTLVDLIPDRETLNKKILNHYKYREIGFETVGRFLDELKITMSEIMPRYNELFKSVEIMAEIEDPFGNVDMLEEYSEEREGTSTTEGSTSGSHSTTGTGSSNVTDTSDNKRKLVDVDTPQTEAGLLAKSVDSIDTLNYGSNAQWEQNKGSATNKNTSSSTSEGTEEGSSSGTSTSKDTVTHTFHRKGNQGVNTYAHDMIEFRDSIIDVVDQIINDTRLNELFMCVF